MRKFLASWRGKDFNENEAKNFDITKLIGAACMLNVIHKASKKDATTIYANIGSISPVPKGLTVPAQINPTFVLDYDNFNGDLFNQLPDFIKTKMQTSLEFAAMQQPHLAETHSELSFDEINSMQEAIDDDLPF